jgi:predicted phosphoadenosine phosphosulfate sulfurtransferase
MGAKSKIKKYIYDWEKKGYINGIPDEAPSELEKRGLVPSYRMICIAIIKNPRQKCNIYQEIKREEIYNRPTKNKQLKLFL